MNTTTNILSKKVDPSKTELAEKLNLLFDRMANLLPDGIIIAFSGGVDSAFLLWAADQVRTITGGRVLALTTNSESMPVKDLDDAISFVKLIGVEYQIEKSMELSKPEYSLNDANRCYYCKTELFRITRDILENKDYKHVLYGYNFSDIDDTRPGHKAALENDVVSPLSEAKLTKEDIRFVMQVNNLPFYDKPSSPCLSSRIMHGIEVNEKRLQDIQEMENILYDGGLKIYRVRISRITDELFLRIEVAPKEMEKVIALKDKLWEEGIKRGYKWVTLDLQGYRTGGGTL